METWSLFFAQPISVCGVGFVCVGDLIALGLGWDLCWNYFGCPANTIRFALLRGYACKPYRFGRVYANL